MKLAGKPIEIVVVLVEPSGPINLGSVARLCANFEVKELRLINPLCDPSHPDAIRMAVKGSIFLKNSKKYNCLIEAISDCRRVVATCGRIDHGEIPLHTPEKAIPWLLDNSGQTPIALIFGREDRGLTNAELQLAQRVITVHSSSSYPSLNLSHAVAVVLHELNRHKQNHDNRKWGPSKNDPASPKQINDCLDDAQELLLEIGFLLEHTAKARMQKIKGILQRAAIQSDEVSLIRGILRQFRWAISSRHS